MSSGSFAFNLSYGFREVDCATAQCYRPNCRAIHRRQSGDATLTISGPADDVQRVAAQVIPGWPEPSRRQTPRICAACGAELRDEWSATRCQDCIDNGWTPLDPPPSGRESVLTVRELEALPVGGAVYAGAFGDAERDRRVRWMKLLSGRWQIVYPEEQVKVDDSPGVSATWLANNRRPKLSG